MEGRSKFAKKVAEYLSMLPLVGKLAGESTGYKSVADWKKSFGETEYEPKDLGDLPIDDFAQDAQADSLIPLGDYNKELRRGRDPEESLGLPSGEEGLFQGSKAKSAGKVGISPRSPWETGTLNKFRSPLFKYLDKKDQKHIRNRLEQYGSPIIDPAPYYGPRESKIEMDHSQIWNKPKKKVEEELKAILTNKRSI